jgi:hypothetical protein
MWITINLLFLKHHFKVLKKISDSPCPLPNMEQYFLCDDKDNLISFWNDVNININSSSVTIGI